MSDLDTFKKIVDELWELVFGTIRRPEVKFKHAMMEKPKRARTKKGTYRADDKSTKEVNEAWVGGKAPMSKKERNALDRAMRKATKFREKK